MKKNIIAIFFCALLVFSLSACKVEGGENINNSSTGSDPSSQSQASDGGDSSASSQIESSASSESENTSSDSSVSSDDDSSGVSSVPEVISEPSTTPLNKIIIGTEEFVSLFEANELDANYLDELQYATSNNMVANLTTDAAANWKQLVGSTYQSALDSAENEASRAAIKAYYDDMISKRDEKLAEIEGLWETDSVAAIYAEMNYYRDTVAVFCNMTFEATGELPSLEPSDSAAG